MGDNSGRNGIIAIVVLIAGLLFYRMWHPSTTFAADGIDPSWDMAVHQSHDAGLPTVVLFTADWCPACRSLHANVLSRNDVRQELNGHYYLYTVNLTSPSASVQAHAQRCGVHAIPLLIRYDTDGRETDRTNYLTPDDMIAWLKAGE
jgi:thiol:disulfide interchange protein DsbD